MKKVLILLLVLLILFSFSVNAESPINVELDEQPIFFDTEPIIQNGTTLVPLRAIFEALGASVEWNNETRTVTSVFDGTTVKLTIDSKTAYKNGLGFELLSAPVIVNGRTLVPVRFISESFGLFVDWEPITRTVLVSSTEMDWTTRTINRLGFRKNKLLSVYGGDLSGNRQSNVKVDVGFGERDYWAFTNEYGQLAAVIAENIILQNEDTEPVNEDGRYYPDEAKVPGTESPCLDEGHVIADSLGGVSNAYNITPQDSTLGREGDQAYVESIIRQGSGCSQFVAIITYPDTKTQIPNHYSYKFLVMENQINVEFDNVTPEVINKNENEPAEDFQASTQIHITKLDKRAEYVIITNEGSVDVDISKWVMVSEKGNQSFTFPSGTIIKAGASLKITSGDLAGTGDFTMDYATIWNNYDADPAVLYNSNNEEIDRY
ncbi:MAG: lamin tail domain-containing protein [Tissierellales bacterium]|nr:lamin tail domain-containing protein [Tissierellales bacterium]MBN2828363.1 lamin tail domain-containing protein [Tissierellales bacterium]